MNRFRLASPPLVSTIVAGLLIAGLATPGPTREPDQVLDVWPERAPGETTRVPGEKLPRRPNEDPPATRVKDITRPRLHVFRPKAAKPNGAAVLIFPGGGYNYVVADKEGSEAAEWLNGLGITAFVLHYRTKQTKETPRRNASLPRWSERPLQDAQRSLSLVRGRAAEWQLKPERIGVLGFSAGGQLAALVTTRFADRSYEPVDERDRVSCRPDFSMLIYPWRLLDERTGELSEAFPVSKMTPPTLLVHAHDDHATSLGSVFFYAALKRHGVGGELHIYASGGHGYGMRPVPGSKVDTWPDRAADWLKLQGWAP